MSSKTTNHQLIKDLEKKVQELDSNWKRALADYQNLEQRIEQRQSGIIKFANAALIDKLLTVLDDLDRAVEHHPNQAGIKLIRNQLRDILTSEGVSEIKAAGEQFDPNNMDCLEMVKGPKNQVVSVSLKGYRYHDRVIRPAKVTVGRGQAKKS